MINTTDELFIAPLSTDEFNQLMRKIKNVYPDNKPIQNELTGCSSLKMGLFGAENVEIKVVETDEFYDEIQRN